MSRYDELLRQYEDVTFLEDALRGVPANVLDRAPGPGKWTIRQIAVHLADAEMVAATRVRWIAAQPGSSLKAYDQDLWASQLSYGNLNPQDALEVVRWIRRWTAAMLKTLPESAWTHKALHEERGELALSELVQLIISHGQNHARQISTIRSSAVAA